MTLQLTRSEGFHGLICLRRGQSEAPEAVAVGPAARQRASLVAFEVEKAVGTNADFAVI